jgi:nucleotide-binding universal stress UspA family protein
MKIVVPLDLSTTSARAIEPAVHAARCFGDELQFVTVAGDRIRSDLRDAAESEHASIPEMIEAYLKSAVAEVEGVSAGYEVLVGEDAAHAIIEYAAIHDSVRMIVIASHGRSGFERWRLGSVAERVVRHSDVPVLVVPARSS